MLAARTKLRMAYKAKYDNIQGDIRDFIFKLRMLTFLWGEKEWFKIILQPKTNSSKINTLNDDYLREETITSELTKQLAPYHITVNVEQETHWVLYVSKQFISMIGNPVMEYYERLIYTVGFDSLREPQSYITLSEWKSFQIVYFRIVNGEKNNLCEKKVDQQLLQFNLLCYHNAIIHMSHSMLPGNTISKYSIMSLGFSNKDYQHRKRALFNVKVRLTMIMLIDSDIMMMNKERRNGQDRHITEIYQRLYSFLIFEEK